MDLTRPDLEAMSVGQREAIVAQVVDDPNDSLIEIMQLHGIAPEDMEWLLRSGGAAQCFSCGCWRYTRRMLISANQDALLCQQCI